MFNIARGLKAAPKRLLLGIAILGGAQIVTAARLAIANETTPVRAVVELFSSQGCSSSPPANQLIVEISKDQGLIILSLNVPYWDYIGWRDTLADPSFAKRQKAYAIARGDRQIYTPQAVINGLVHVVGNEKDNLRRAIEKTQADASGFPLLLKLTRNGAQIALAMSENDKAGRFVPSAEIWAFWLRSSVTVQIEGGDNRGRNIVYHNAVRRIAKVGDLTAMPTEILYFNQPDHDVDADRLVVLIQRRAAAGPGEILGAAQFDIR